MLGKLFGSKKPVKEETPHLPDGVRQTILDSLGCRSIPSMPQAAQKAFLLATNPTADARDYTEVLECDEGLSARVLKLANSVFYDRGGGSKTIPEAVMVVGISELKGVLNATALANIFPIRHPLRSHFWSHDIATALTARLLARNLLPSQADQVFLGGLMHDIGKLLLLQKHTDTYDKLCKRGISDGLSSVEAELLEYPFDHTHVGHLIAERWNFSEDLTAIIRNHHRPWGEISYLSPTGLVKAANIITHALGLVQDRESNLLRSVYEPLLDEAWEHLRLPKSSQDSVTREAQRSFEEEYELYASWGTS
jgi:putative nucleotidyltransferase with HDIG domain